jgi:hypothetical protein
MMAVKLSVLDFGALDMHQTWWINFIRAEVVDTTVDLPLSKWGAKNCPGPWIEFERDEDATLFLLRWA